MCCSPCPWGGPRHLQFRRRVPPPAPKSPARGGVKGTGWSQTWAPPRLSTPSESHCSRLASKATRGKTVGSVAGAKSWGAPGLGRKTPASCLSRPLAHKWGFTSWQQLT